MSYLSLFIACFLASTVLPFASEAAFSAVVLAADADPWTCVLVATAGNSLGGMTCYAIGRLGKTEWLSKYLHVNPQKVQKWTSRLQKHGTWMCLFTFLPGIGDLIAIASGFVRSPLLLAMTFMIIGRFARYLFWMHLQGLIL